jgi:hypothetical protein
MWTKQDLQYSNENPHTSLQMANMKLGGITHVLSHKLIEWLIRMR